eukprot:GHVO01032816.1.p1 GENE.GHVO01032816.1~~GHVO01032816.1.p1  ORF type:complete len:146 (-),score=10.20 GHVO01032816.1:534-971(-)
MWFYRRALKISYEDHITNEEVLRRMGTERSLLKNIRKRQAQFFGHVMRKEKLEYLITTGKIQGHKSRGRPREKILDGISGWLSSDPLEILRRVRDRKKWKDMVANALRFFFGEWLWQHETNCFYEGVLKTYCCISAILPAIHKLK